MDMEQIVEEVATPFGVHTVVTWKPAAWIQQQPEPAKPATPAGLCVVAEQTHKLGGWGL